MYKEEYIKFTNKLRENLSEENAMLVQNLIKYDERDENLMKLSESAIKTMVNLKIFDGFYKTCAQLNIKWLPTENH